MTTTELQRMLIALGYDLGSYGADGVFGRLTTAAVAKFQADYKVPIQWQGTVGPKTEAALTAAYAGMTSGTAPVMSKAPLLPWYSEAERLKGVKEIAGSRSNSTILGWAGKLGGWVADYFDNDDIPWCGLFVAHCIGATLPSEPLPSNPLSALAWKTFGVTAKPTTGAILVFSRSGGGHVGFYAGERADAYYVLGGNQSNAVNLAWVSKDRHVATRWPKTAAGPTAGAVNVAAGGALSTNEA